MNKTMIITAVFLMLIACYTHAQWNDGVLIDVQEVSIDKIHSAKMPGAEAVMKVVEQYTDRKYRFAFISNNYLIPAEQKKFLNVGKERFLIAVAGYPLLNDLLFTQVLFDQSFFFVVLTRNESDMKKQNDIQTVKMHYDKGNSVRRNNIRDIIQRNNIIPLGIDTAASGRYF